MDWLRRAWAWLRSLTPLKGAPLCDTCKYDYGDACRRPERPNAITCPDYKRR